MVKTRSSVIREHKGKNVTKVATRAELQTSNPFYINGTHLLSRSMAESRIEAKLMLLNHAICGN